MHEKLKPLFEAHVTHELAQWRDPELNEQIDVLSREFWQWAQTVSLGDLTTAEQVTGLAQRRILDQDISAELGLLVGRIARHLIALPVNRETRLGDVISDSLYTAGVDMLVELRHLREEIIRQSVRSPVFEMLIADNLYQGIHDYLSKENVVAQKMPGMSKLIGKSTGALTKATGMSGKLDAGLRRYIDNNAAKLARQSEQFLYQALNDQRIREVANDLWQAARESHLSMNELLRDEDVDALVEFGRESWAQLRQSDYLKQLIGEGIGAYFTSHSERPLTALLAELNIDQQTLHDEFSTLAPPVLDKMFESGYLEALIRRRLRNFYDSDTASALITGE